MKITLKTMINIYVCNNLDPDVWDIFHKMACYGLIDGPLWDKFADKCKDWCMSEDFREVIDWDGNTLYTMNEDGFWVKA